MTPYDKVRHVLRTAIADGAFPGSVVAFGGPESYQTVAEGTLSYAPDSPPVDEKTWWDLASLTKILAMAHTAMAVGLDVERKVSEFLPGWDERAKKSVRVRQLLDHTSGLPAVRRYEQQTLELDQAIKLVTHEPLERPPGEMVYSDLGPILVGAMVGLPNLRSYSESEGLRFTPNGDLWPRCAPTEAVEDWRLDLWKKRSTEPKPEVQLGAIHYTQGEAHDPRAVLLGGVAGHAGLFGTIDGVAKRATDLLKRSLSGDPTLKAWTRPSFTGSSRGLAFDLDPGPGFSCSAFGHTGFTGTMLWVAPGEGRFVAMVSNRVHPTAENLKIREVRKQVLAALAVGD